MIVCQAATNELGIALLLRKKGLPWETIKRVCELAWNIHPRQILPWLPADYESGNYSSHINPALRPVYTPDVNETIQKIFAPDRA
jgi:hypothetical protein